MRRSLYPLALLVLVSFCLAAAAPSAAVTKQWAQKNLENKTKGHVSPDWTIFQDGTAKSVTWQNHSANPRFAVYDSKGDSDVGNQDTFLDDMVMDKETGLVWQRKPNGVGLWYNEVNICYIDDTGGRMGWRLATLPELGSLIDKSGSGLMLPPGHPFYAQIISEYWTATENGSDPSNAYTVDLLTGLIYSDQAKGTDSNLYWCVRGGTGLVGK
jgi:hypothetical protein